MSGLIRGYEKHLTPPHPGWQRTDPLDRGLVGEWRFDPMTGLAIPDFSGYGGHGTSNGGPAWFTGELGPALNFQGNGFARQDEIAVPDANCLDGWPRMSLEVIVRTAAAQFFPRIVYKANSYLMRLNDAGTSIFFYPYTDGVDPGAANTAILAATWYHIIGVYDGANSHIYVNGVLKNTNPGGNGSIAVTANDLFFGSAGAGGDNFAGDLALVRLYGRDLSDGEVRARYEIAMKRAQVMTSVWMIPWALAPAAPAAVPMPVLSTQGVHSVVHGGQIVR